MAVGRDADPHDHHGVRPRPRRRGGDRAARHDQARLRTHRDFARGRLYAMQPGRRPARDPGGQRRQGHPRHAGEGVSAAAPLGRACRRSLCTGLLRAALEGPPQSRQTPVQSWRPAMTVAHADIAEPTDRIGSFSRKALAASAIGYAMDGFDLLILGFMLRAISAELHLTPPQAGSLITWTLIGAVAGGILFGMLSHYYGRVRVLTWTILLFAVFTGLGALAQGYWDLLFYRTIAGLGLGGEFGIGMALVAEAWPASQRARVSSYVGLGWQLGVLAAALLTPLLLPVIGWRGMFALGLAPAVVSFVVRRRVEEPALFVERAEHARQVARAGQRTTARKLP